METIIRENFQAAFVNTTQRPIKKEPQPFYKLIGDSGHERVQRLVRNWYSHPDAPEELMVPIEVWEDFSVPRTSIESIKFICEAMRGIEG